MANKKKARLSTDAEFVRNRLEVHSKRVVPDPQTLMMLFDIASRCQRILQRQSQPNKRELRWLAAAKRKLLKLMKVGGR